ncbi:transcription repressor OFP7-like [Zingiber officinale]|uniref:Transcription repressor n=1 Tax=Zingiber officinale TaxID=94328 RepID=A0A8J5CBK8_ZINOF|nr:transcription repressor OFP7-like [Zingiber officinale]KAG6472259.1 hypothetical protein ZIOFF_069719 [Zingiber officinale]
MAKRLRRRLYTMLPSLGGLRSKGNAVAPPSCFDRDLALSDPSASLLREQPLVSPSRCCPSQSRRRAPPEGLLLHPGYPTPAYLWRKEKWWHVVTCAAIGGSDGHYPTVPRQKIDSDDGVFPPLVLRRVRRGKAVTRRPRSSMRFRRRGRSNSSADDEDDEEDDDDSGWFSSGEEMGATISTSDVESSDKVPRRRWPRKNGRVMTTKRCASWTKRETAVGRLIPFASPAVKESFAVVKLSEDPEEDFRRSMAEMVAENKMYDVEGLEQLLCCFLSLNSSHHHAAIVAAFEDIWDTVFPAQIVGNVGS